MGVAKTQATLKAQVPEVCRFYCSQVWNKALKQAGVEASSDLWKVENVYYPPAIRETAPISSEAESAPKEAEIARPEPAEEGELPGATETHGSLNLEVP